MTIGSITGAATRALPLRRALGGVGISGGVVGLGVLAGCGRPERTRPAPTSPTPTASKTPSTNVVPTTGTPLRVAQFNVRNLFDTVDQPRVQDDVPTAEAHDRHLGKLALTIRDTMGAPDIIALQEVEHEGVLRELAARPELQALGYEPLLVEGSDPRGIDVAYLYRPARVQLVGHQQLRTTYVSPAGRNIQLFTRPPLVATFQPLGEDGVADARDGAQLTLVNNHFTSKLQGADGASKRMLQAAFVASIADGRAGATHLDPARVIVLGDFNEALGEPAYEALVAPPSEGAAPTRINAADRLPETDRYSYRDGTKRWLLDHVLLAPKLTDELVGTRIPHVNSDPSELLENDPTTPQRASDHDPVIVDLLVRAPTSDAPEAPVMGRP